MDYLETQILLFYYDRPFMIRRFALESVCRSTLKHWELAFIDDSSRQDGEQILSVFFNERPQFRPHQPKIQIYKTSDSLQMKRQRGQALIGKFANIAMEQSGAALSIMLCDDDGVTPDYLLNLSAFYNSHSEINYSYCHVLPYDPSACGSLEDIEFQDFYLNYLCPIRPERNLDSSQVSWRREAFLRAGMTFPFPQTACLDAAVYSQMCAKWGPCAWNGLYGQYKGWFSDQLGNRAADSCWDVRVP